MKYVIILLLAADLSVSKVKFESHGLDCGEMAYAWIETHATYRDGTPNQGWYTPKGELVVGHTCE
tara:strand:+ start:108 stop:302 length:195 start_codon:yes stop_codon:yes gene_type:complete